MTNKLAQYRMWQRRNSNGVFHAIFCDGGTPQVFFFTTEEAYQKFAAGMDEFAKPLQPKPKFSTVLDLSNFRKPPPPYEFTVEDNPPED